MSLEKKNKKLFFKNNLSSKKFISIIGILGSAITTQTNAQNTKTAQQTVAQNSTVTSDNSKKETNSENKSDSSLQQIDPTKEVAGGVGEKGFQAPKYAVLPTGKTLPKGIFKVDIPVAYTFGGTGFNGSGSSVDNGVYMKRWIVAMQIQYGITNSLSFGVGIPYFASNGLSMDGNVTAANAEMYHRYYEHFVDKLAAVLSSQNNGVLCAGNNTVSSCRDFINNSGSLNNSSPISVRLPTGEDINIDSSSPLKNQIRNILLAAAQPSSGASGLGDLQLGFLWSIISEESPIRHVPLYFSLGGGLRIPTGQFNLASAYRNNGGDATLISGGGTYDAILRFNLDYIAIPGLILSWQHQSEYSMTKADLNRSSMLDNTKSSNSDSCAKTSTGQQGDCQSNTLTFSRKGLHHVGFVQAAWGLGTLSDSLKWGGIYTQAKYNIAAQAYLNDQPIYTVGDQFYLGESAMHPDHGFEQYYSASIGTKFSGLPYRIPAEFTAEFEYPFAGKNRMVSPMNAKATFSIYF